MDSLLTDFHAEGAAMWKFRAIVGMCNKGEDNFFNRLATMDVSWIHYFDPETKETSKQWKHVESPPPKKVRTRPSAGKIMLSVFLDQDGAILTNYLQKGRTITGRYYSNLLMRKSRRKGVAWLARDFCCCTTMHLLTALSWHVKLLENVAMKYCHIRTFAPADFFVFLKLQCTLRSRRFNTDNDVIAVSE